MIPVLLALALAAPAALRSGSDERVDAWGEDLLHLVEEMQRLHPDLFHSLPREEFEELVGKLYERLPELDDDQTVVELMRLIGQLGRDGREGHSLVWSTGFHLLPLQLYRFEDGWFVVAAREPHAELVRARLVSIGGRPVEEVCPLLAPLLPVDNEMNRLMSLSGALLQAELLHALGVGDERERATLVLEQAGERSTRTLEGISWADYHAWRGFESGLPPVPGALWKQGNERGFWLQVLEPERALYVQYNSVRPVDEHLRTLEDFAAELVRTFGERGLERVLVDVRSNGGGDNTTFGPLLEALATCPGLQPRGRLYCLIGRETFSAAGNFTFALRRRTNAIFVGEPTGGAPDQYGDSEDVSLPHHPELLVRVATRWHDFGGGDALATVPDLAVPLTSADYFAGRDPVLRAALEHAEPAAAGSGATRR